MGESLKTLEEILRKDGNFDKKNIVLKMYIEGAERDVFDTGSENVMKKFPQIVVEFHYVTDIKNSHHYQKMIKVLDKILVTHKVIHVHGNNYEDYLILEGIPVNLILEVTYVRKKNNTFKKNTRVYPIKGLDQPNNPQSAEVMLAFVDNELMN